MASSLMHIAIAQEINKELKRDKKKLLIGSVAPDISKIVGKTKVKSHFLNNKDNVIPNLELFLKKYKKHLNDDFVLGYYIHLYTDYLWFKYFIPEIINKNVLTKLDGKIIEVDDETKIEYIYNDYSNLNIQLINEYNLNINIFYDKLPKINKIITEIPIDKLHLLMEKTVLIIENSKVKKSIIFNLRNVEQFISISTELILSNLNQMNIN